MNASMDEESEAAFTMRLVSIDYYMERPVPGLDVETSAFMGSRQLGRVPVVRLFGRHIPSGPLLRLPLLVLVQRTPTA